MKKLMTFFKQLQLKQILIVCLAVAMLCVSTACSTADARGARPNNLPVQAGGQNNPYKVGGDTNTNYNLSPDPKVSGDKTKANPNQANLPTRSNQLVAAVETLYPGAESPADRSDVEKALPKKTLQDYEKSEPSGQVQREASIGGRVQDRVGKVKQTFDEASEFINENAGEARTRHEEPGLR